MAARKEGQGLPSSIILLTFIAACVLLAVTPGPNMALIIANTLRGGLAAGFVTLAGTSTGLAVLVAVAALGMSSIMAVMSNWFDVVRWCGAVYLALLGARQLWAALRRRSTGLEVSPAAASSFYVQGLAVSLSNPKVLLFLGAFLPQFVDTGRDALPQLAVLAVLFVLILLLVDVLYTLLVARARTTLHPSRFRALDGLAGVLLMAGGVVLATARRP
jgi:threonine/homoserine/homoserine lactone efflux protein